MRRFLTPRWLLGHLLAVAGFAVCLLLGWWQLARFESPTGGVQNAAYALQWPVFGVFVLVFWVRAMRDALGPKPTPPVRVQTSDQALSSALIRRQEQDDPALAAYNRYLAQLNAKDTPGSPTVTG